MNFPRIVSTNSKRLSPWVVLQERCLERESEGSIEVYHSFGLDDYVTVLAISECGKIPIVRQYRPAIQDFSLEFPGGIVDDGEEPVKSAERELCEETGFILDEPLIKLGSLSSDTGRLDNRLWAYFAKGVKFDKNWKCEAGIEVLLLDLDQLKVAIHDGKFNNSLHLSLIALAMIKGLICL